MFWRLFAIFALIPIAEIYVLISIGSRIGVLNTIALVIVTAFLGAYYARQQGIRVLMDIRAALARGTMPTEELIDGVLILVAGIVLLTPGLITDTIGLLILFPATRVHIRRWVKHRFAGLVKHRVERRSID